jgi:DNA ligase-1
MDKAGGSPDSPVAIDTKLDGIRIQVHRHGDDIIVATRSLEDITGRLPEVVAVARALPSSDFVLDGEVLALDDQGRPRPFQETASRTAMSEGVHLTPYFFDLLHLDGRDLVDSPGSERLEALAGLVPEEHLVPRLLTSDVTEAEAFVSRVLDLGHEGVVVKNLAAPYDAGRRGSAWVKVKPVHTLDLVVLAVEWGSGRRRGWLSNIHLGARDGDSFVMLGKTFKGMTDEMLAWQTERFLSLETNRDEHVVYVEPVQVVEVAFDGVQRSTRYPGGVALRFARVLRYRDDKGAGQADTIRDIQAFLT